jgi:hypothetical protein
MLPAIVLFVLIVAMGAARWVVTREPILSTSASLVVVQGEATVTRAGGGAPSSLRTGRSVTLHVGDEVRTAAGSRAKLTFAGGETTELGPGTHLGILELEQAPESRALVATLALYEGQTLTRIRHMLFHGMRFQVETRVATVTAQGTIFQCDVVDKNHTYVAVYDGVVSLAMGQQVVQVQAGQAADARLGQRIATIALRQPEPTPIGPAAELAAATAAPTPVDIDLTVFPPIVTPTRPGEHGQFYVVVQGDTLYGIARRFGVTWDAIWEANKPILEDPENLKPGQRLYIPD